VEEHSRRSSPGATVGARRPWVGPVGPTWKLLELPSHELPSVVFYDLLVYILSWLSFIVFDILILLSVFSGITLLKI
jgi:hypothetical protein